MNNEQLVLYFFYVILFKILYVENLLKYNFEIQKN